MEDDISSLRVKRGHIKAKITRLNTYFSKIDSANVNESTILQLKMRLLKFEPVLEEFNYVQTEIETLESDESSNEKEREHFENDYFELMTNIQYVITKYESEHASPSVYSTSSINSRLNSNIKLPVIKLPIFKGAFDQWLEFRDAFGAMVHNNNAICKSEKFYYLKSSLSDEALRVIQAIEVSDVNYDIAWKLLLERYENKSLIVFTHIKSIFELYTITKESHIELRRLFDDITKHLRALQSLGLPTEHWDALVIYIITIKLDVSTRRDWEAYEKQGELPTMMDMNKFLKAKCELLEKLEQNNEKLKFKCKHRVHSNVSTTNNNNTNMQCYFCKNSHTIYNCETFLKLPVNSRIQEAKMKRLCINCLRPGHSNQFCKLSGCRTCQKRHNSLLHLEKVPEQPTQENPSAPVESVSDQTTACNLNTVPSQVILSTAIIQIKNSEGQFEAARALLDNGSQSNFITKDMCDRLGLRKNNVHFSVEGVGHSLTSIKYSTTINLLSRFNNYNDSISCLIIPSITGPLPAISFELSSLNIPANIKLADPRFNQQGVIDILLGAGIFWRLLSVGQISLGKDKPVLQKTQLGWIVAGSLNCNFNNKRVFSHLSISSNVSSDINIDKNLMKFWQLEECNNEKPNFSKNEEYCENYFMSTYQRNQEGRFVLKMPLYDNVINLGNSRELALNRFYAMERKLVKNEQLRSDYVKFMKEYNELGHMDVIAEDKSSDGVNYYLPHHPVIKESSLTTKVRVVFDASMKTDNGLSLNDVQYVGPTIQNDLLSIIMRFRKYRYVIGADISKMYRQVLIANEQRPLQRIFWRNDPDHELKCYELKTVTYGTASAPYLATRCLYQLAVDHANSNPVASKIIKNDFYMDDLLTGSNSMDDILKIQVEVSSILASGGFELRKWLSNSPEVTKCIQVDPTLESSIIQLGENQENKTLGVVWNASLDVIQFSIRDISTYTSITKRLILSIISQIFDPLGLLGPVIVVAKIIMQHLWQAKLSWDESVPQNIYSEWLRFSESLYLLNNIKIPRWVLVENAICIELHAFSDASETAFGSCVYIRCKTNDGNFTSNLLCAKSRVAPLRQVTLPRLELCAAQLLAHLVQKVRQSLDITFSKCYYWCDSTITLGWIRSSPNRWKTFVANRVSDIQGITNPEDWYHVRSQDNPADLLSRGINANQILTSKLWWEGPAWLSQDNQVWHNDKFHEYSIESNMPEQRTIVTVNVSGAQTFEPFAKYSNLTKLQRITAYILRFLQNVTLSKENRQTGSLTPSELKLSLFRLVKMSQRESFPLEYNKLLSKCLINRNSHLLSLDPFLDEQGIMRVKGRIQNANCNFEKTHPMILAPKHELTRLILTHEHERLLHCGPQHLLYSIREQFWPIAGRNLARSVVRKCVKCFRMKPSSQEYKMGNLPSVRVNQYVPFYNTGLDYAGPILIKDRKTRGPKMMKAYICLFICMSTKAIHLEVVTDLTTQAFLAALKRFIARRGRPISIYSDNGSNFIGADAELQELSNFFESQSQVIIDSLSDDNISWHFIPPRAPNFGGVWEAGIKSVKHHLKRVIGNVHLHYEDLCTVLIQIEGILNSRPLSPLSSSPLDDNPLTPAHFLIGRSLTAIPEPSLIDIKESRLTRYQRLQQMIEHFWQRWHKEYLSELQSRSKWKSQEPTSLKIGSLVVVKEDNQPPLKWNLGRITDVHPGKDGIVRVVTVKLPTTSVKRAVSKVCVLPIAD